MTPPLYWTHNVLPQLYNPDPIILLCNQLVAGCHDTRLIVFISSSGLARFFVNKVMTPRYSSTEYCTMVQLKHNSWRILQEANSADWLSPAFSTFWTLIYLILYEKSQKSWNLPSFIGRNCFPWYILYLQLRPMGTFITTVQCAKLLAKAPRHAHTGVRDLMLGLTKLLIRASRLAYLRMHRQVYGSAEAAGGGMFPVMHGRRPAACLQRSVSSYSDSFGACWYI